MKIPKLTKGDLVEIIWSDTNVPEEPGWMTEKELSAFLNSGGGLVQSVGIYNGRSKNKKYIQLVGDTDADDQPDKSALRTINIAIGYILHVYQLIRVDIGAAVRTAKKITSERSQDGELKGEEDGRTSEGVCGGDGVDSGARSVPSH